MPPVGGRGGKNVEGVDVSEPVSISTGIAARYATAIFELARDDGALDQLDADVGALDAAIKDSADFVDLIKSPVYSRTQQQSGIAAVADKMGLSALTSNTLKLMADKRRLFVLPQLIVALRELIAAEKGEITANVTSAKALTKKQTESLAKALKANLGNEVRLNTTVDDSLIGGLIVKVGSKMIDTSIRSKLAALQNTMKEVG